MDKKVQIPMDLFLMLVKHHIEDDTLFNNEIKEGLYEKIDSMLAKVAYDKYKNAKSPEEKEKNLNKYLELTGKNTEDKTSVLKKLEENKQMLSPKENSKDKDVSR